MPAKARRPCFKLNQADKMIPLILFILAVLFYAAIAVLALLTGAAAIALA